MTTEKTADVKTATASLTGDVIEVTLSDATDEFLNDDLEEVLEEPEADSEIFGEVELGKLVGPTRGLYTVTGKLTLDDVSTSDEAMKIVRSTLEELEYAVSG